MTREELLKMSKKDLKNRLAELGKNAQTLSGQELTDAMDEARTIGEILDEIKGREELEAAARAAGAADPDEGDGAGDEFTAAGQKDYKASMMIEVWGFEYEGQTEVMVDGRKMAIYRTYGPKNTGKVELYAGERIGKS